MTNIHVKKRNGRLELLNVEKINKVAERICKGLDDVSASEIVLDSRLQFYDKITTTEIDKALILTAAEKTYKEPNYSYVAARFQLNCLYKEVFGEGVDSDTFELQYKKSFISSLKKLSKEGRINPNMLNFDLKRLSEAIVIERDDLLKHMGIRNLYDRYFIKLDGRRLETPQAFWMRVAMGLSLNEPDKNGKAIEFYNALSTLSMCSATPTLFNSGTVKSQLSSCFLNTFDDSIDGIFEGLWQEARKSKHAGGLGFDVTPLRATGSYIQGTNGSSGGLIPWLKIYNDTLIAVNQGGMRAGAGCAYLEPWHLDVEEFLQVRQTSGDERRRTHNMNTALWVPDLFFTYVKENKNWYLFSPNDVPDLHELFSEEFNERYEYYCRQADAGEIKNFKIITAKNLWKEILKALYSTSHPWLTFKDPCNMRYSNQHEGVVHSSNLCTEIMLHTIPSKFKDGIKTEVGETAVCNLASVNLREHTEGKMVLWDKLKETVKTAIRMLDNVIDLNYYPTLETKNSNMKHRPIGLGIMGFHDICHILDIQYDSDEGVKLADDIQQFISYWAIHTSSELAAERGVYSTYEGSLWSKGLLPIDTFISSQKARFNTDVTISKEETEEWAKLRAKVLKDGMRNSNVMAIAPTSTISYIQGCEQSIEPNFSILFTYENISGNTSVINEHFVKEMKEIGIWSPQFAEAVKAVDGDVMVLDIPEKYKQKYKQAFDRDMFKLIEACAARQKWIDQGQSFNIYNGKNDLLHMQTLAFAAHTKGLKTTYYWRMPPASKIEKSTSTVAIRQETQVTTPEPTVGLTDGGEVVATRACSLEARLNGCESCQ